MSKLIPIYIPETLIKCLEECVEKYLQDLKRHSNQYAKMALEGNDFIMYGISKNVRKRCIEAEELRFWTIKQIKDLKMRQESENKKINQ